MRGHSRLRASIKALPANPCDRRFEIRDLKSPGKGKSRDPGYQIRDLKSLQKVSRANPGIGDLRFES